MKFSKMQGLGNDFVLVNGFTETLPEDLTSLARKVCNRHLGVGADGLILVIPSGRADIRMRIFNADGSEPEMCGNGIRCVAKFASEAGLFSGSELTVETLAGIIRPELIRKNGQIIGVKVDMGEPRLQPAEIPVDMDGERVVARIIQAGGSQVMITAVSMGNPHCILFVDSVREAPVDRLGPELEKHLSFPAKTNVEFVQVINKHEVSMRVWERGVGETLACGTGACAVAVASALNEKTGREMTVHLLGGDLFLQWADNNHVLMTGPCEEVFTGKLL